MKTSVRIRRLKICNIILFSLIGCVEPYELVIRDSQRGLVVETYLSDKSFYDAEQYPSDGRYSYVKLSYTSDVINLAPTMVTGAAVSVESSTGEKFEYQELQDAGKYLIADQNFKALPGIKYKLHVTLPEGPSIESSWETLPETRPMGEIGFNETEKFVKKYEAGEPVFRSVKGINTYVTLAPNNVGKEIFYRWKYDMTWIYVAPEVSGDSPVRTCWVVNPYYLNDYVVRNDHVGNYNQPLFFMETVRNDRIYKKLSVLFTQEVLSEDHFYFWKEMQERNQGGLMTDIPPYNLKTNLRSSSDDLKVFGYFGVVGENAKRWYFEKEDLSYPVDDTSKADCNIPFLDQAPQCTNCLLYAYGAATNIKPSWWEN